MSDDVLVKVEGASKKFCRSLKRSLWYGVQDVTSELLCREGQNNELRRNEFWAVDDISFELKRGECLGLVGPNGAGKSTLLKMLNGLVKPDRGRIAMRGRVGALIELGAGFNPILTARENIYVNGSVIGFSKNEIKSKFDDIVEFAEIDEFLDTPVQNFSSGMKVRLGFSIASQLESDVMLIDEVLAVGDASFKMKCMARMYEQLSRSCVIFVSHSMAQINRICTQGIYIQNGRSASSSEVVARTIEKYLADCSYPTMSRMNLEGVVFGEIILGSGESISGGKPVDLLFGEELDFAVVLNFQQVVIRCAFMVSFFDQELRNVAECYSDQEGFVARDLIDHNRISVSIDSLNLSPGIYSVQFSCVNLDENGRRDRVLFVIRDFFQIRILGGEYSHASTRYRGSWNLDKL